MRSMSSRDPPYAAAGSPPPMTLPMTVRSGSDAGELLGAAGRDAEAGDDLVEDEQRAVGVGALAQQLQEAVGCGGTRPMFAG